MLLHTYVHGYPLISMPKVVILHSQLCVENEKRQNNWKIN